MVILHNVGERTYHLRDGKDKEGKIVKRVLAPNGSIEALDEAEAKDLLGYGPREIVDASKAIKPVGDKIAALEKEIAELKSRNAELEKKLKKYEKD